MDKSYSDSTRLALAKLTDDVARFSRQTFPEAVLPYNHQVVLRNAVSGMSDAQIAEAVQFMFREWESRILGEHIAKATHKKRRAALEEIKQFLNNR